MKVVVYKNTKSIYSIEYNNSHIDWTTIHPLTHRYEVTVTFNPKWYSDLTDMESAYNDIIEKLIIKAHSALNQNESCHFNYVKEYQSNGAPHMHGTLMFYHRLTNSRLTNWEQFFQRLYGKTQIWYTGDKDKIHKNDHYEGPWSGYLKKDNPENYESVQVLTWKRKDDNIEYKGEYYQLEKEDFDDCQNLQTIESFVNFDKIRDDEILPVEELDYIEL